MRASYQLHSALQRFLLRSLPQPNSRAPLAKCQPSKRRANSLRRASRMAGVHFHLDFAFVVKVSPRRTVEVVSVADS
jgi:hypothetical protein